MKRRIFFCILAFTALFFCSFPAYVAQADNDDDEEIEVSYSPPMGKGYEVTQCPGNLAGQNGCVKNFSHGSATKDWGTAESWDLIGDGVVRSVAEGEVIEVGNKPGPNNYGNYVKVRHPDGTISFYAHLNTVSVDRGDDIDGGDKIGIMGNSGGPWCFAGCSKGVHLHFSLFNEDGYPMSTDEKIDMFEQEGLVAKGKRSIREGVKAVGDTFGINVEFEMEGIDYEIEWDEDLKPPKLKEIKVKEVDVGQFRGVVGDLYRWSLGIGAMLAFLVIIYGGILYILSAGSPSKRTDAKEWITSAIIGLILLFAAYLILTLINPCLVRSC